MRERRKYVRSNGLVLVNYKIPSMQIAGKSSAYDISATGVRITVEQEIKPTNSVEMEIYLPGSSQPILGKGEVVWVEKHQEKIVPPVGPKTEYFHTGIKFTIIDENNKTKISNYIQRKLTNK